MRATGRKIDAVAGAMLALLFAADAKAQVGPNDLTVPPELRGAAPARAETSVPRARRTATRVGRPAGSQTPGPAKPVPEGSHPVDFGVVVRGGSATPHIVSPLGSSQAVQESGSAVGAGMRFGF